VLSVSSASCAAAADRTIHLDLNYKGAPLLGSLLFLDQVGALTSSDVSEAYWQATIESSCPLFLRSETTSPRHRPRGSSFDETRFGEHHLALVLATAKLIDPFDSSFNKGFGEPVDVGNLRLAPLECCRVILTD